MDNKATVMRQQMDETMVGLTGKLGELERQVSVTVSAVKDSVNTVRNSFDIRLHVRRRPWALVAGAVALGYLGGYRANGKGARNPARYGASANTPPARVADSERGSTVPNDENNEADAALLSDEAAPGWLANLGDKFRPEIAELKGIAIGTLVGLVREIITNQLRKPAATSIGDGNNGSNGKHWK